MNLDRLSGGLYDICLEPQYFRPIEGIITFHASRNQDVFLARQASPDYREAVVGTKLRDSVVSGAERPARESAMMQKSRFTAALSGGGVLHAVAGRDRGRLPAIMRRKPSPKMWRLPCSGNTLPTGAILVVLITILGPISGAHFNPAVSLVFALSAT